MVSTYALLAPKGEGIQEAYYACTVYEWRLVSDVHWAGFVHEARVDNVHVGISNVLGNNTVSRREKMVGLFEQAEGDLDVPESVTEVGS